MLNIGLEQQQMVRGADGTLLWLGGQAIGASFVTTVAVGSVGIGLGEGVFFDSTNTVIPRSETTAAGGTPSADLPMSFAIAGIRSPAAAGTVNPLGVAQETTGTVGTALTTAKRILVASVGSLVAIQTTAVALTMGNFLTSSATAGLAQASAAAVAAINITIGSVFKINSVAATGTGSTGWAGVLVTCATGRVA